MHISYDKLLLLSSVGTNCTFPLQCGGGIFDTVCAIPISSGTDDKRDEWGDSVSAPFCATWGYAERQTSFDVQGSGLFSSSFAVVAAAWSTRRCPRSKNGLVVGGDFKASQRCISDIRKYRMVVV